MMVGCLGDSSPLLQQMLHKVGHGWYSTSSGTISLDKVRRQKPPYRYSGSGMLGAPHSGWQA